MLMGKVVRFDEVRGYGFIAPDDGSEDVFVHANVLGDDKFVFGPGLRVEFEATNSDRGPKAYAVHLLPDLGPAAAPAAVPPPVLLTRAPVAPPVAAPAVAASGPPPATMDSADDELCDVLTASAFGHEITELLLKAAPTVTAAQILDMRAELISFGRQHGWIEG
jgi:CspA family cold shock protein